LHGDAGMVQLFRSRPELVRYVEIDGVNPDVDTAADLAALNQDSAPEG
jgi:CTP:molybdopterin cytidylyltransferase MocA